MTGESKGICTKCNEELARVRDSLMCPVCGESVNLNILAATQRLGVPYPSLYNGSRVSRRQESFRDFWNRYTSNKGE